MPKGRLPPSQFAPSSGASLDTRQRGLRAFQTGRFDEAITLWTPLAADARVQAALAEAYFRRGLAARDARALADLRAAVRLAPAEQRYRYQLGMRLHRQGELAEATACYREVVAGGGPRGAALLLALATLEASPRADLAALPGSTPDIHAVLAPAQALLTAKPLPPTAELVAALRRVCGLNPPEAQAVASLWSGLAQVAASDSAAATTLEELRRLPNLRLTVIGRAYRGVAAAQAGDQATALRLWQDVAKRNPEIVAVAANLAAATHARLAALRESGATAEAAELALQSHALGALNPAFSELRVQALDGGAQLAATSGDWTRAALLWESARQLVGETAGLGSPRPLLHNLALAYEALEQWEPAAESWRAMLRTRPRKQAADTGEGLSPAHWAWVRKRVVECYKLAGRPDEAVTIFRQMVKAEPNDLELRLQLADALLANEQLQAAQNEVQRILQIDGSYAEAQLRNAAMLSTQGYLAAAEGQLRQAVAQHPEREDLRRHLARLLQSHADKYMNQRNIATALKVLEEAQQLDPESPQIPLDLARISFDYGHDERARAFLERATALADNDPTVMAGVFRCWLIEEQIDEARAVVAHMEAGRTPSADTYLALGAVAILETTPPPKLPGPFAALMQPEPPPPPAVDTVWTKLGRELLDKAIAQRPDDAKFVATVAMSLMAPRPDLALPYAEQSAKLAPDQPQALIVRALALALNERIREAKDQLGRAAALARRLKLPLIVEEAESMRREISSPLFRVLYQSRAFMRATGMDDDLLDDLF